MLDRRSFFKSFIAGVAAVFGYKTASAENHGRLVIMTPGASLEEWGARSVDHSCVVDFCRFRVTVAKDGNAVADDHPLVQLLSKPNKEQDFDGLVWLWEEQYKATKTVLTWMVPNRLGVPMELYCIPAVTAVPQAAVLPEYPHGYYKIQTYYENKAGVLCRPSENTLVHSRARIMDGSIIPAEWMLVFAEWVSTFDAANRKPTFVEIVSSCLTSDLAPFFGEGLTVSVSDSFEGEKEECGDA